MMAVAVATRFSLVVAAPTPRRVSHLPRASSRPSADSARCSAARSGGICGSGLACTCNKGNTHARAGDKRINNKGSFSPQETWGTNTAPGYVNGIEISCAHCMQQNTSGALYTRWGNMACPAEHSTVYSGHMAAQLSSTNYGGSQYLCLTEKMAGLAKTRAGVFYCCCFV